MQKLKILILVDYIPPRLGGMGEVAINLKKSYEKLGHICHIACLGNNPDNLKDVTLFKLFSLRSLQKANNLLKENNYDIVHNHQSLLLPFFKKHSNIITSFHTSTHEEIKHIKSYTINNKKFSSNLKDLRQKYITQPPRILLEKLALKYSRTITSLTKEVASEIKLNHKLSNSFNINIVGNGINKSTSTKQLGNQVFYCGGYKPRKRLGLIQEYTTHNPRYPFTIIGPSKNLSFGIRTKSLGQISNDKLQNLLKSDCRIFCCPSSYEGQPVAILEALSYGIPCLISNCRSHQCFKKYSNVYFFKQDNLNDFSKQLDVVYSTNSSSSSIPSTWDEIAKQFITKL